MLIPLDDLFLVSFFLSKTPAPKQAKMGSRFPLAVNMLTPTAMTVDTLRAMLPDAGDVYFIDVRDPDQFEEEHVAGIVNVPLSQLFEWMGGCDRKKPVIVLCANGKKAGIAADVLKHAGFIDVRVVAGGILSWKVQSFPTATKRGA
jgi:adenylyltransferase/sulfurtransferase